MIIRKPYAFLIKNFRKIHFFLLLLCGYVFYINFSLRGFVSNFITLGVYDIYTEPITKYTTFWLYLDLFLILLLFCVLMILLRHKKKPWKVYLLPLISYSLFFITTLLLINYFSNFSQETIISTDIRAYRDLLFITYFLNYPIFIFLFIRILGLDLARFGFQNDKEFFELSNEDREEIEINFDFDKTSIKRTFKRLIRNLGYVYREHKFKITFSIVVMIGLFGILIYRQIFIINRFYHEGESFNSNGYTIKVNKSFITDKDYMGNIIEKNSNFVIVSVSIKNLGDDVDVAFNKFHLMNSVKDYVYTSNNYESQFDDFGDVVNTYKLGSGKSHDFVLVYKVSKKLDKNKFVLFYQEINGYNKTYLRKIKINLNDISKIKNYKTKKIGEEMKIKLIDQNINFKFEDTSISDNASYNYNYCGPDRCEVISNNLSARPGKKIMMVSFSSDQISGKDLIDFSSKYGKIIYKDSSGKIMSIAIENVVSADYLGKYMYILIDDEISNSNSIKISYVVRNKRYIYVIK